MSRSTAGLESIFARTGAELKQNCAALTNGLPSRTQCLHSAEAACGPQGGSPLLMLWTGAPGDRQKVDGGSPSR
jgi:hypothetical protein